MKKDLIKFVTPSLKFSPQSDRTTNMIAYFKEIDLYCKKKGLQLYLTKPKDIDNIRCICPDTEVIEGNKLKQAGGVKPDILYVKQLSNLDPRIEKNAKILNNRALKSVCIDKRLTHESLSKHPKLKGSLIAEIDLEVSSRKDILEFLQANPEIKDFILKPKRGQRNKGIEKVKRNEVLESAGKLGKNPAYILQSFIDSELMLRYLTYSKNGKPFCSGYFARVPKDKKLGLLGGDTRDYYARAPIKGKSLAKKINQALSLAAGVQESFIAVDLLKDRDGRLWLLEVNSNPGFVCGYQNKKLAVAYAKALIEPVISLHKRNY